MVDPIFIVPWFLLLAVAIGVGFWRGAQGGMARGFRAGAMTFGIGVFVLLLAFVALVVAYYAGGGH